MTKEQALKDVRLMGKIANRARKDLKEIDLGSRLSFLMDLEFIHKQTPLALDRFLAFPLRDFTHDIVGIHNHFNRQTKQLERGFAPRCTQSELLPMPDNIKSIWDNKGETVDRYSIMLERAFSKITFLDCLSLSADPTHPLAVSQFSVAIEGKHLGKRIQWEELEQPIQAHIISRLKED